MTTDSARESRVLPLEEVVLRDSGDPAHPDKFTIRGYAAVFNRFSLDLGGFKERIAKGAFGAVLDRDPDVHAVWDHDTTKVLARTRGGSLELREDPRGLHMWARVADTSYARDLRVLMEAGLVDQASFAFTVAEDEWRIVGKDDDERVERTIVQIGELYDVTVTAQGAYPTSSSEIASRSLLRSRVEREIERGNLPEDVFDKFSGLALEPSVAAAKLPGGTTPHLILPNSAGSATTGSGAIQKMHAFETKVDVEAREPAPDESAELEARRQRALQDLRNLALGETALAREQASEFSRRRFRLTSRD